MYNTQFQTPGISLMGQNQNIFAKHCVRKVATWVFPTLEVVTDDQKKRTIS